MSCYIPYADLEATLYSAYRHDFNKYKDLSAVIESVMELSVPAEAKIHAIWYYSGFVNSAAYKVPELQTKEWKDGKYLQIHNYLKPYLTGSLPFDFTSIVDEIKGIYKTELDIETDTPDLYDVIFSQIFRLSSVNNPGVPEAVNKIINDILDNVSTLDAAIFDPNVTISGQLLQTLKEKVAISDQSSIQYTLLARIDNAIQGLKDKFSAGMEYQDLARTEGIGLHKGQKIYRLRRANGELMLVIYNRQAEAYMHFAPGTPIHETAVERRNNDQITPIYYFKNEPEMVNPKTGALRMRLDEVFTGISLGYDKNENQDLTVQEQISNEMSEGSSFYNQIKIRATTYLPELNAQRMDAIRQAFPSITRAIETMERPAQADILAKGKGPILTYTRPTSGFAVTVSNFKGDLSFDLKPFINLAFVYPNNNVEQFNPNNPDHVSLLKSTLQVRTLDMHNRYVAPSDEEINKLIDAIIRYEDFQQEVLARMQEIGSNDININDIFYKYYDLSNTVIKSEFVEKDAPVSTLKQFIETSGGQLSVKLATINENNELVGDPFTGSIPIVLRKTRGTWTLQTRLPERQVLIGKSGKTYRSIETYLTEELGIDLLSYVSRSFNTNDAVYISLRTEEDVTKPVVISLQYRREALDTRDTLELVASMLYAFKRASMIEGNTSMVNLNNQAWGFDVDGRGIRPEVALLKEDGKNKTFGIKFTMLPKDGINNQAQIDQFNEYAKSQMNILFDSRLIDVLRNRVNEVFTKTGITVPDDGGYPDVRRAIKQAIEKLGENDPSVQGIVELYKGLVKDIENKFDNIIAQHDQDFAGAAPIFSDTFRQYGLFDGENLKLYRRSEREQYIDSYYALNTDVQKKLSLTYRDPLKPIKLPAARKSTNLPEIKVELEHLSPVVTIDPKATPEDPGKIADRGTIPDDPNDLEFDPGSTPYSLVNSLEGFFFLSEEEQAAEIAAMKALIPGAFTFTSKGFDALQVDGHALGYLQDMFIHINNNIRARGTAYHEGFHAVFRRLLTREQQIYYLTKVADSLGDYKTDAKGKYIQVGKKKVYANEFAVRRRYTHLNDEQIRNLIYEEYLADGFATYMETNKAPRTWMQKLFNFFKKLLNYFKKGKAIDGLYYDIASGKFRNAPILETKSNGETVYSLSYYGIPAIIDDTNGKPKPINQYIEPYITAEVRDKLVYAMAEAKVNYPKITDSELFDVIVDKVLDEEYNLDSLISQNPGNEENIRENLGSLYESARWLLGAFHRKGETFLFKNTSSFENYNGRPLSDKYVDVSKNSYNRFKSHVLDEYSEVHVEITEEEIEDQLNEENDDTREEVELGESYKDVSFVGTKPHEGTAAFRKLFKYIPYKYTYPKLGVTRTRMVDSKLIFSTIRKISANLEKDAIIPRMQQEIDRLTSEINYFNTKVKPQLNTDVIPEDISKTTELRDSLQAVYDTLQKITEPNEDGYPTKNTHFFIQFQNVFHKVDARLVQVFNDTIHSTEKEKKGQYGQMYNLSDIVVWGDISNLQNQLMDRFYQLAITKEEAKPIFDELTAVYNLFQDNDKMTDLIMVNGKVNDVVFREKIVDRLYLALSKLDLGISYNLVNMGLIYDYFSRNNRNLNIFDSSSDYKKLLESNKQYWKDFDRVNDYLEGVGINFFTTRIKNAVEATFGLSKTDLAERTSENLKTQVNKVAQIYKKAGEFMLKYDPTISGSVTRNANGDMINKYVDGTPAYSIVNTLKNAESVEKGINTILDEYYEDFPEFFANNPFFNLTNPAIKQFWEEFDINAFAGFHQTIKQGRRETENEPTTFRGIDDKAYALSMMAMFAANRRVVKTSDGKNLTLFKRILSQYEATSTSLVVDGFYKTYVGLDGTIKKEAGAPVYVQDLLRAIKQEYELIRKNYREIGKSGVKRYNKYNVELGDRGYKFNTFSDFFAANRGLEQQFLQQAKNDKDFEQLEAQSSFSPEMIMDAVTRYAENQYNIFETKLRSLGITANDIPREAGRDRGLAKDFFFNTWINAIFVNQLFDGPLAVGVKNFADYYKRQKSGAAAGTNLYNPIRSKEGRVTTYRAAIIKDIIFYIDNDDLTKPMSVVPYDSPGNTRIQAHDGASIGNIDRMIRVAESDGKLDLDAQLALFKMKFVTKSSKQYRDNIELLADRKIVFNNIKSVTASPLLYFKQSEHILIRKDVSYLNPALDPDQAEMELEDLYTQMDFYSRSLEAGINGTTVNEETGEDISYQEYYEYLANKAHSYFKPVRGKELLHNFLNSMELHRVEQMMDTTASKRAGIVPLDYDLLQAGTESYYFDLSSSIEDAPLKLTYNQLSTDKVSTAVTQGIQQKLLAIAQLDPNDPDYAHIVKDIIGYQQGLADAVLAQTNKLIRLLQTSDKGVVGQIYTTIASGLREQGADATILQYFELDLEGNPKNNPNLRVISNILVYYYFSIYNKNIFDKKISGRKFYHVSPVGYQIREKDGRIITDDEYRKNPEAYKDATVRYPTVTKDEQGRYIVEVILPKELERVDQEFLQKHLFKFFATRIPTEDKRSMMVAKVVDYIDEAYGAGVIVPYQMHMLSGSDFDIDSLYAHFYSSYKAADRTEMVYGDYGHYMTEYQMSEDEAKFVEYLTYMSQDDSIKHLVDNSLIQINEQAGWNVDQVRRYATYLGGNIYKYLTMNESLVTSKAKDKKEEKRRQSFKRLIATFNVLDKLQNSSLPTSPNTLKEYTSSTGVSPVVNITFNKILDHKMNILSDPTVYERFMANTDQRADKAAAIYKEAVTDRGLKEEEVYNRQNVYTPTSLIVARAMNSESKDSLGIAASFNKGISMLASIGAELHSPVGRLYQRNANGQIIEMESVAAGKIIKESVQLVGGAIGVFADAPKNPFPAPLNLNSITTPVMLTMFSVGVPQKAAIMFQSLPIIAQIIDEYNRNYNSAYSKDNFVRKTWFNTFLKRTLAEKIGAAKGELDSRSLLTPTGTIDNSNYKLVWTNQVSPDTQEQIESGVIPTTNFGYEILDNNDVPFIKNIEDILILNEFSNYMNLASDISFNITRLTDPMKAIKPDFERFDKLMGAYNNVLSPKSRSLFTYETRQKLFKAYPVLRANLDSLKHLDETSKMMFLERTELMRDMISLFDNVYDVTKADAIADIKGYIQMQLQNAAMNSSVVEDSRLAKWYNEELDPENFLNGHIIKDYYKLRGEFPNNSFLKALKPVQEGRSVIPASLLELAVSKLGASQKDQIFTDLQILLGSPKPDMKEMAHRIAFHGMIKSGGQKVRGGFFELLPTKFSTYMSNGLDVLQKDLIALDKMDPTSDDYQKKLNEVVAKNFNGVTLDQLFTDAIAKTVSTRIINQKVSSGNTTLSLSYVNDRKKSNYSINDFRSFLEKVVPDAKLLDDKGMRIPFTLSPKNYMRPDQVDVFTPVGTTVKLNLNDLNETDKVFLNFLNIQRLESGYSFPLYRVNNYGPDGQILVLREVDGKSLGQRILESKTDPDISVLVGTSAVYEVAPKMGSRMISPLAFSTEQATAINNMLNGIQQLGSEIVTRMPAGAKVIEDKSRMYIKTPINTNLEDHKNKKFTTWTQATVQTGAKYNVFKYKNNKLYRVANNQGGGTVVTEEQLDTFAQSVGIPTWEEMKNNSAFKDFFLTKEEIHLYDILNPTLQSAGATKGIGPVGEVKPGVSELFESNPELANAVYEAAGFYQPTITANDKIIFGHPTIGKTFLKEKGLTNFISFDDDFADEINNFVNTHKGNLDKYQYKQNKPKEYIDFSLALYDKAKRKAKEEGKILFTSSNIIFQNRTDDFDKVIDLDREEFFRRINQRNTTYDIAAWKDQIDSIISKVNPNKVIKTRLYLSDLLKNATIKPTDKIIWGHPAIGKSYAAKKVKMIDFDSYKIGINRKYNLYIAPGLSDTELRTDDKTREARENWRYESEENQALWNQFIRDAWQQAKQDAKQQGAILFASDLLVLREFGNEVDKALTMPDELFFERSRQRNNFIEGELGTKVWKGNLNKAVSNFKEKFGEDKVISTDKYLSDLFITPQQKQQAQQLYSEYINQTGKQDIQGFKEFVSTQAPTPVSPADTEIDDVIKNKEDESKDCNNQ